MAKSYMEVYADSMAYANQERTRVDKLGEAFIIESLVELSGQVSTSEQLMEFFDAERIEAGLVNLLTLCSETGNDFIQWEDIGVIMAILKIEQQLKAEPREDFIGVAIVNFKIERECKGRLSKNRCLASVFTERMLLRLETVRRSPSKAFPSFASNDSDSPSVDPSLFDRVKLLIARGELKGSVWKSQSTWAPLLTSVFESFHQSLKNVFFDLNNKAPHPIRDLLKYHPSPLSLINHPGYDFETSLSRYTYTGGHKRAVELNVATEIELGLDSAARKEMAVGVVWLDQLDVQNSTSRLPHSRTAQSLICASFCF